MFDNEIKSAGFVMFWRNDERIDTLPLDTQGFYFQLVRLVCHADGAKSYDGKPLLAGQYGTSLARISDRFGLSIQQVRTHFKRLSDAKIISLQSNTRKTLITICNYSTFHQNIKNHQHTEQQTINTPNNKPSTHIEEELLEFKEFKESSLCANEVEVKKKPEPKKTPREQAEEKGFLELWEAGKNKSNRQSAERKFLEAIKEVSLEVLVSQRKAYNLDMEAKFKGRDVNYQGIDVWLNKKRWEDEYSSSPKQSLKKEEEGSTPRNSTAIDHEAIINAIKADKTIEAEFLTLWPNSKPVYFRKIREFVMNASNPRPEDFISYLTAKG